MTQEQQRRDEFSAQGDMYEAFTEKPFRRCMEVPSVLSALGLVGGESIFDLGCGAGVYTRILKTRGASRVVGYDRSTSMLEYARDHERRTPLGIEFVNEVPESMNGSFDVVLSVYVMPYATTEDELHAMSALAARMLRPGGRFVTLPIGIDPVLDLADYYLHYGFRLTGPTSPRDGDALRLEHDFDGYEAIVTPHFWSRDTVESTVRRAGFRDLTWLKHHVTDEGIAEHGAEFWQPYLTRPHADILACRLGSTGE